MIKQLVIFLPIIIFSFGCSSKKSERSPEISGKETNLRVEQNANASTISVFRGNDKEPILTQNAKPDFRPYMHPITAPDGKGVLTEYSPGHHKHQTGLYWGFTRVNGRDYFHNPQGDYWRRVSADVMEETGTQVTWQTVYDLLDEKGNAIMRETQKWSMREVSGKFLLDLDWSGEAQTDVVISKYDYGGLFLRMPWKEGIRGEVVNAARQRNEKAEGQPAMWVDVGMQVEGRKDLAHIAIFDHPDNKGYPQPWRVDGQLGIGPARARTGDWTIPKGETEVIRHQLVVYTGDLNDVSLTEAWGEFSGQNSTYALWQVAQREGREAKFLTPDEAVKSMTLTEGFKANVWASEPMMTQPMAFCWDDRGRLWIAENRDYESRGHGFSNAGDSRILILEDTDRDGVADTKKVFLEGIAFPAAIAVGFDGVFLGAPPNLLFVPDRNKDDKADEKDIKILLTGWGIQDRHETLNSLHWGPDGWLYGLQGFATPSKVRKPKEDARLYKHKDPFPEDLLKANGVDINGGVWRYHPTKDRFEVVAHGFSNPWGIDYDAKGQFIMSACVIPHLWHVIPGGIYHRQGGQHFNPYIYSDIRTITDHSHRSAHGGARIYLSDAFPDSQQGRVFMANIHEHAVLSDVLERKGSGYTGHHGEDFAMANNAQWVGFSMEIGPDGGVYVLDWHDADICGKEVLNAETGRIFRIMPESSQAENWQGRYGDLRKLTDKQLVDLQTSKSDWHARRSRVILQGRAAKNELKPDTHDHLRKIFDDQSNPDWRLRAMWALHITGGFSDNDLPSALDDKDEYVRSWAIQMLCEDQSPIAGVLEKFSRMALDDESSVVRLYLASAMQRINKESRWKIAEQLMSHEEDAGDHNLPKMIWFGFEPLVAENPDRALHLASSSAIPLIAQYTARRAVDADATEALITHIEKSPYALFNLLEGMRDGLESRNDMSAPSNWTAVYLKLQQSKGKISEIAVEIAQQFGDTEAAKQSIATLKDKNAPLENRRKALHLLATRQRPELLKELPALLEEPAMRMETISAIAEYDTDQLGQLLIRKYPQLNHQEKTQALQTLSSRPRYGRMLTQALKDKTVPKSDVPVYVARQLRRVVGSGFVETWGPIDELPAKQNAAYDKYRKLLTNEALAKASPQRGRLFFQRTCGSCHTMYGEGGIVGPDITGSNRTNVEYILSNVLNPSDEIQDDYKMVVVTTRDGRTYSGNISAENERQVTMRIVGQDAVVINKSDIQSREQTPVSMMPPGLFGALSTDQVLDLVAYLRTSDQVKLP
ncbi:MAG: PVC-type heme-binding CxxCH protein [Cyclobacteriaceae bacterium]